MNVLQRAEWRLLLPMAKSIFKRRSKTQPNFGRCAAGIKQHINS